MPRLVRPVRQVAIVVHDTYLSSVRAWLLIPAFFSITPLSLAAQRDAVVTGRTPRRAVLAVVGALVGAAGGAFLHREGTGNACRTCYIGAGTLIGGAAGLLIGRELDQMHAVRFRGVPRLRIPFVEEALDGDPLALTARDTLLAVATSDGVTILSSTATLVQRGRRANGIRGISALDLTSRTHAMAVATPTGLYLYPPVRGPGVLLREGTIQAASASEDHVFFALGSRIEWAAQNGDSARVWPGLDIEAPVADLEWDGRRQILWALTDTLVLALRMERGYPAAPVANPRRRGWTSVEQSWGQDRRRAGHGRDRHPRFVGSSRSSSTWRGGRTRASCMTSHSRVTACTLAPDQRECS